MPELGDGSITLLRVIYGWLLLATLIQASVQARRFFLSERWGGYAESSPVTDVLQSPVVTVVSLAVWIASTVALIRGQAVVPAALVNLLLCRYHFVSMRWQSLLRGMGAPGFMTYWLGAAVLLLEVARRHAPQLRSSVLLLFQVDFAMIMLSAGIYKWTAGYPQYEGMELGLANPEWGYWYSFYGRLAPRHLLFRFLDQMAWSTEIVAALLMVVPATRFLGGAMILVSFAFIATQLRLGFLCETVMACCLLFFAPGSAGAAGVAWTGLPAVEQIVVAPMPGWAATCLELGLWGYLVLLPVAHGGQFYNFYAKRPLPGVWQRFHDAYCNAFGIIIWRVFSVDVVNFFVRIWRQSAGGERSLVSRFGSLLDLRYNHVGESIVLTSLFTTQKYYPSNDELFRTKLLRYARTVSLADGEILVFEHVRLVKDEHRFRQEVTSEYLVAPAAGTVEGRQIHPTFSSKAPGAHSPIHEAARPGSYLPLAE